jgi:acid phosphatase
MTRANFSVAAFAFFASCACGSAWPAPDHVVIVVEENKAYEQIIGSGDAPYINALAKKGALLTRSYAVAHPSQPNYLALFSGDTQGVVDDRCPVFVSGENLASGLAKKKLGFRIYSESMPSAGFTGCAAGPYMRKHNPAVNWQGINVSPEMNVPFTTFSWSYPNLPTVSIVVPNQLNDMHDGEPSEAIRRGDQWLKDNIDPYVQWAGRNNSLLILTWDEDDDRHDNHIVTIFVGPMVKPGAIDTRVDHYGILRTLIDAYGLQPIGKAAARTPVKGIWKH